MALKNNNCCAEVEYYSGQGALMYAVKDPITGLPLCFKPFCDVDNLAYEIDPTVENIKESCSGLRGTAKRVVQEIAINVSFDAKHFGADIINLASRGTIVDKPAATGVTKTITITQEMVDNGCLVGLDCVNTTITSVTNDTQATTLVDSTHFDWTDKFGSITLYSDAEVVAAGGTTGAVALGDVLTVTFDHPDQCRIDGLTDVSGTELYLRFEGLNTIEGEPVVVEFFNVSLDPAGFNLISDDVNSVISFSGEALIDNQITGVGTSPYYRVLKSK